MNSDNCWLREDCRLCASKNLEMVLELPSTPPANEFLAEAREQEIYPLKINLCINCGHAQLSHVVNPKLLFDDYLYVSGTSSVFKKHFESYANKLKERFLFNSTDLVCEIGSNDGTLLRNFKNFKILGIEPAKAIAARANNEGVVTLNSYFDFELSKKIKEEYGGAQVIIANNVMAHIDDLDEVLRSIKLLLTGGGVFVMEVQYLGDLINGGLFDMIYFEHLDYHAVTPLVSFFEKHKLRLFDVEKVDTHGGSIRCFVCHQDDLEKKDTVAQKELLLHEKAKNLNSRKSWDQLENLINKSKSDLLKVINDMKSEGKKIIAYGAPAKLTTLFYTFGLTKQNVDYVVDDSPFKTGRYTPGEHIPIYDSKVIYQDQNKPDVVIISAWNFSESIIKMHSSLQGVTWITPLPKLKITKT